MKALPLPVDHNERSYSVAEVFPEYKEKEQQVALRAYRHREDLTQRRLAGLAGIPQRHISEMENGKRSIGKEMAKRLSKVLRTDYKMLTKIEMIGIKRTST